MQLQLQRLSKAMENQTSSNLSAIESTLLMLSSTEQNLLDPQTPGHMAPIVAALVRGSPQLRSLSLVNAEGVVIASTTPNNIGHQIAVGNFDLAPLHKSPISIGKTLHVRDLSDLAQANANNNRFNVVPLVMKLSNAHSSNHTLVALVNLDYFSTEYQTTANDNKIRILLTNFQGRLIVATDNTALATDSSLSRLPVFTEFLPRREWGSYTGLGSDDAQTITAFSSLRQWPMVLIVETLYSDTMQEVETIEKWSLVLVACTWLVIAIASYVSIESMRRHAKVRKRLTQEVYTSEARHHAVLQSSLDGVITIDENGLIVDFNPAAQQIFGHAPAACIGKVMHTLLFPANDLIAPPFNYRLSEQDQATLRMETVALHAGGKIFPIELSVICVRVDGRTFYTANVRDISEQQKSASDMANLLRKYHDVATDLEQQKLALDQHAIVSIVDAENTILYANNKLLEVSGYSKPELIGKKFHTFRKHLPQESYDTLRKHLDQGRIWHGELQKRHRNGGSYWVANTSVPVLAADGSVRQYIAIETDITELRKTEIALKQSHARELDIGNRIQQTLLAASPEHQLQNVWFSQYNQASKGIDGDFVETIQLGPRFVDIIVGDVMGKGVPAALLGAATKLQFSRSLAELMANAVQAGQLPEPQDIVRAVHLAMTQHLQALEAFVTLAYIRIDLDCNFITWVGCGHEETLLIHADGQLSLLPNQHPPLGILDDSNYTQNAMALAREDIVFLCSDGLTDAIGSNGQRLGREFVNNTVRDIVRQHTSPACALHTVRRLLLDSATQLTDDITMAMLVRPPAPHHSARCELPITLPSIRKLRAFLATQFQHVGLGRQDAAMLEVANVEVFTNILRHGQGLLPEAPLEVIARWSAQHIEIEIVYLGTAFIPPAAPVEPDLSNFPEGGFGMTIIRNACDQVDYLHHQGVNTVRLRRDFHTQ